MKMIQGTLITVALAVTLTACSDQARIPPCEENAMLQGTGTFADGHWDNYLCGPSMEDFPTFDEVQAVEAMLEKIAKCPAVERDPHGQVALFYDGIRTFARRADGSNDPISLTKLVRRCV